LTFPNPHLVLLVEDEPLVSFAVEESLTEGGFSFVAVRTADEAIAELETDAARFSALLTDIRTPGKANGWDVAHRARELSPAIPVIYMTGDSAYLWTAHGVPNSVLLQKPFVEVQMMTALATLLNSVSTLRNQL
jgi:CheY-like chemotaxis protein